MFPCPKTVRPNSPANTTRVSSRRPRILRSLSSADVGWSTSRHWPCRFSGSLVWWSQPRWKSWTKRTSLSAILRARRQLRAYDPGLCTSGPYMLRTSFGSLEMSVSSGTDVCIRNAISCWLMVVSISGSPISARCLRLRSSSESSMRRLILALIPFGFERKRTGSPVDWNADPWCLDGRNPLPHMRE